MKEFQRPRPVEQPPSSGSSISGKDGVPLSERLMDDWVSTLDKNSPCEFVARLVAEMFTKDHLAKAPELEEGHIQAIICKIIFSFNFLLNIFLNFFFLVYSSDYEAVQNLLFGRKERTTEHTHHRFGETIYQKSPQIAQRTIIFFMAKSVQCLSKI